VENIQEFAQCLATFCCGLFAGAAMYISFVEHPARIECGTAIAVTEFGPSYRRATVMQATLAVLGFIAAIIVWFTGESFWWLVGGIIFVSVVPFTLIVILPTNKKLLDPTLDKTSPETHELLTRWHRLHAVRTVVSCIALVIFLFVCF
jgi:uncharacterized membrane protein